MAAAAGTRPASASNNCINTHISQLTREKGTGRQLNVKISINWNIFLRSPLLTNLPLFRELL